MNLVGQFLARAEARPDAPALFTPGGERISYSDLARASALRAAALRAAGIGRGDVVLIARDVSPALYETLLAVFRLGAVAMFPEPAAGLQGLRQAIAAARPIALATDWRGRLLRWAIPALRRLPVPGPASGGLRGDGPLETVPGEAPALITFTSGSTGKPKGIVRSASFLMLQHGLLERLRRTRPDDVDLISLPVFILSNLAAGAASVIPAGPLRRPARLDGGRLRAQIAAHEVNRIVAPPAVCARLVHSAGPRMTGLRAVFTGGGPVFPNLLQALRAHAPEARIHAVYGSTEAEPIAHVEYDDIADEDWTAMARGQGLLAGAPIPQIELEIVADEIQVAGAHVNSGYLDPADDASTKVRRAGRLWHRTGDAGRRDGQGRLWLLGRLSAGAEGVYPFSLETAAMSWPGVREAALLVAPGRLRLAVAGDALDMNDLARRSSGLGIDELHRLKAIPTDVRHNSKVDYKRLATLLR